MKRKKRRRKDYSRAVRLFLILLIVAGLSFLVIRGIIQYRRNASIEEDIEYLPGHGYDFSHLKTEGHYTYEDSRFSSSFGIDVSEHQGDIDFEKVKKAGVEFVFLRAGWRGAVTGLLNVDKRFEEYYKQASEAGLKIGFYFFSQAVDEREAVEEADFLVSLIKGKHFDLPLAYDYENFPDGRIEELDRETRTKNAIAFLDRIRMHNYASLLYTNLNWMRVHYDVEQLLDYDIWFAQYYDLPQYPHPFLIWQYSEEGQIDGIKEPVDLNIMFIQK